jgi:periplasmic protein TonB
MFNKLVASSGRKKGFWSAPTALTSIVFHALLVAGIVYGGTNLDQAKKAREELVDFMDIKEDKPEEPKPEEPKPPEPEPPKPNEPPPVVKGFQELQPPQEVPKEIAQPVNDQAVNAEDFSGQGKAGGVAEGADKGVAQSTVERETPVNQGVYDVSTVEERPQLRNAPAVVSAVQRNYPPLLRDAGVGGTVVVSMVINEDGTPDVSTVEVVSSDHEQFSDVVRRVIERMRFRPAKVNNQAVKVRVQLPITFQPG